MSSSPPRRRPPSVAKSLKSLAAIQRRPPRVARGPGTLIRRKDVTASRRKNLTTNTGNPTIRFQIIIIIYRKPPLIARSNLARLLPRPLLPWQPPPHPRLLPCHHTSHHHPGRRRPWHHPTSPDPRARHHAISPRISRKKFSVSLTPEPPVPVLPLQSTQYLRRRPTQGSRWTVTLRPICPVQKRINNVKCAPRLPA